MTKLNTQKGFTLVELAIVMTIIGLLIGGILKGQEMVKNAKVTATLAQVQAYNAAIATFQDKFQGLPGDIANANARIPNSAANAYGGPNVGDGSVGLPTWNMTLSQSATAVATPSTNNHNETLFFWAQLANSNLISGINYNGAAIGANAAVPGTHLPASKLGNMSFVVGSTTGTSSQALNPVVGCSTTHVCPSGLILMLTQVPNLAAPTATGTVGLEPAMAAMMDRKIDDGNPLTGNVQAYGFNSAAATTGCFNSSTRLYNEALSAKDCGVVFSVAG